MSETLTVNVPLNRVEGDLEVHAELRDGLCVAARCSGTMFRGFEQLLQGRGALDGLVITPRICGICSQSHLAAAVLALEELTEAAVPPDAVRLRNLVQMVEHTQSDVRHSVLNFAADFVNPAHAGHSLADQAQRRYTPFSGTSFIEVVRESKRLLELVAILAGQWPHSAFMVPGGITSLPSRADLSQCKLLLKRFRRWYETQILGCSIERWRDVESRADLDRWLEAEVSHRESEVGFLVRFGREAGLDRSGAGPGIYLSFGAFDLPEGTSVRGRRPGRRLIPAGLVDRGAFEEVENAEVSEHVAHSWFEPYQGGKHPLVGETRPYASGDENERYSWGKAPRYRDLPAETGPLAEAVISGHPLFIDLVGDGGGDVLARQLARLVRPAELVPAMECWLDEVKLNDERLYRSPGRIERGVGSGLTQAARGALGHWVRISEERIEHYQIITPTTWNASPRDSADRAGPLESALEGTPVRDPANPIELGHVVRSFDPCLVCTVHAVGPRGRGLGRATVGWGP